MPRTPGINAVLERLLADDRADLHVATPGTVQSYDPTTQTADVRVMVKRVVREQDDERAVDSLGVLSAVPVCFMRAGGYFLAAPPAPGDSGLLVFCERDPGPWRHTGQESDPLDEGLHGLTGAVFFPGLEVESRALPNFDHLVLGKESGPSLHIDGSHVDVGAQGGSPVILANASFLSWIAAVSAATGAPAPTGHVAVKARAT